MKELIETLVKPLVDFPDEIRIDVLEEKDKVVYKLSVHQSDVGKVIGKNGRIIKALRTIVTAHAHVSGGKRVFLEIDE